MKYLFTLLFICASVVSWGQGVGTYEGYLEKAAGDYYFHEVNGEITQPARIVIFKNADTTRLAATFRKMDYPNEVAIKLTGTANTKNKVYRRGMPFTTIEVKKINAVSVVKRGSNFRYYSNRWYMMPENTQPQQDSIFEVYYGFDFNTVYYDVVNGRPSSPRGISVERIDGLVFEALKLQGAHCFSKNGIYLKVKAQRWYGSRLMYGKDAEFNYMMKVTQVLDIDTTRTRWGYYNNELEQRGTATLEDGTVIQPPADFVPNNVYNYTGGYNGYTASLQIIKTAACHLSYVLSYTYLGNTYTSKGIMELDPDFYSWNVKHPKDILEYAYGGGIQTSRYIRLRLFTEPEDTDITKFLGLEFYNQDGNIVDCSLNRVK
ncbi:hypothetical protein ACLI1A_13390 [Flavobacterium sp. RHBU_3]|uniref:hypothetical protein n=1 Tax=Flavobacterium sp. RHBU_3 TaxID=3391184 RepID=UPI0039852CBA